MAWAQIKEFIWSCDFCMKSEIVKTYKQDIPIPEGWDRVLGPETGSSFRETDASFYDRCGTCKLDEKVYTKEVKRNRLNFFRTE